MTDKSETQTEQSKPKKASPGHHTPFTVLTVKREVSTKAHSIRTIEINSPLLLQNMQQEIDGINLTRFRLQRTFSAYRSASSQRLFEAYFDESVELMHTLVKEQVAKHGQILQQYQKQGYKFKFNGSPALIEYTVTNSRMDNLISLYLSLDKLITSAIWLEKTEYWNETACKAYQEEWIGIVTQFRKNLQKLVSRLQSQFKLSVKVRQPRPDRDKVNFEQLNEFLFNSRREYLSELNPNDTVVKKDEDAA
jgi:hypothetical protein